jgi:hypothetical protein
MLYLTALDRINKLSTYFQLGAALSMGPCRAWKHALSVYLRLQLKGGDAAPRRKR